MPSLIDLRRRVRSIRNTQQITKAMKMVSAARLRRAQDRVINARPYARIFDAMLADVSAAAASDERVAAHPLLAAREEKRIQLILITADRGLAGAYNANLIRAAQQFITDHAGQQVELEADRPQGARFFTRREARISGEVTGVSQTASLEEAQALAEETMRRFAAAEIDSVYLLYNEFKSVLTQRVTLKKVLPLTVSRGDQAPPDYIYEQPPAEFFESSAAALRGVADSGGVSGACGRRTCRAHDGDGRGHQQRQRCDEQADPVYQPRAPGEHYAGDHRGGQRRRGGRGVAARAIDRRHKGRRNQPNVH